MTSDDKLETINDLDKNLNKSIYKEQILKEPDYSYWRNQEPLDWEVSINKSKVWTKIVDESSLNNLDIIQYDKDSDTYKTTPLPKLNTYVWTDTISLTAWDIKKYTTWFKPSKIEINAINTYWSSGSISSSIWYSTWDKGHINFIQYSDWDTVPLTASYDDTLIIWVYRKDSWWTRHHNEYYIDSINLDWFNLKCQTNDQWDNVHIIISCI